MKILRWVLLAAGLIQLIPYGHTHSNPPSLQEPAWNSPDTRDLFRRACFDCHSNATVWPWYSNVAPVSWLVLHDVEEGRRHLNFSEWTAAQKNAPRVAGEVKQGDMPPSSYLWMHPAARLTDAEKSLLVEGAEKTLGPQSAPERRGWANP